MDFTIRHCPVAGRCSGQPISGKTALSPQPLSLISSTFLNKKMPFYSVHYIHTVPGNVNRNIFSISSYRYDKYPAKIICQVKRIDTDRQSAESMLQTHKKAMGCLSLGQAPPKESRDTNWIR